VPKVHNKLIKRPKKVQTKRTKDNPKTPWSGAPDCPVCHRTVSGTPGNSKLNSSPSGKWRPLRYNSPDCSVKHRTVSGVTPSGATATSRATVDCNAFNARLRAQRTEHAQLAHRTVYRTGPVHHRTSQRPHKSELQRSNPNGWLTWLAHRTVRCAMRQQSSNRHFLWLGL
jgi:hypothetical protein